MVLWPDRGRWAALARCGTRRRGSPDMLMYAQTTAEPKISIRKSFATKYLLVMRVDKICKLLQCLLKRHCRENVLIITTQIIAWVNSVSTS